jgi:hypothetical protein
MRSLLVFCALVVSVGAHAQTFSCPAGTEDMMNYFVMSYPNRIDKHMGPGNANPIYSAMLPESGSTYQSQGVFLWIKSLNGSPWDIKAFDSKYIYDRATELNWNDPTSFKRFTKDLPISQRCIPANKGGAAIKIPPTNTAYNFYASCQPYQTKSLSYVLNNISMPVQVNVGNVGKIRTRYFKYRYACDSTYSNCKYMEVFSLGYGLGDYDWKYYTKQNGQWVMVQESVINQFSQGQTTASLPCTTTYQ